MQGTSAPLIWFRPMLHSNWSKSFNGTLKSINAASVLIQCLFNFLKFLKFSAAERLCSFVPVFPGVDTLLTHLVSFKYCPTYSVILS